MRSFGESQGEKIRYSKHFRERMRLRGVSERLAREIFYEAEVHFEDIQTQTLVAVKKIVFKGKERDMALIYRRTNDEVIFITLHPLKENQRENRVRSGRWRRI